MRRWMGPATGAAAPRAAAALLCRLEARTFTLAALEAYQTMASAPIPATRYRIRTAIRTEQFRHSTRVKEAAGGCAGRRPLSWRPPLP